MAIKTVFTAEGTPTSEKCYPLSGWVLQQLIPPLDMPVGHPHLGNPSLNLSSQKILSCVKWAVKVNHHSCVNRSHRKISLPQVTPSLPVEASRTVSQLIYLAHDCYSEFVCFMKGIKWNTWLHVKHWNRYLRNVNVSQAKKKKMLQKPYSVWRETRNQDGLCPPLPLQLSCLF